VPNCIMRLLELFSGTGSIGNVFSEKGWEVVSVDLDPKTNATIHADVLTWDHTAFPQGHFDAIWASPCCTHYSRARTKAKTPRDLVWADSLVTRTFEIIEYFQPRFWFVENPQSGMLKERPFMSNLPFADVDYCCYCDWGYRKRTRLWNNVGFSGLLCPGVGVCQSMEGRCHKSSAQQGKHHGKAGVNDKVFSQKSLHRIPPLLCEAIEASCR
jgi:hypothetical protein